MDKWRVMQLHTEEDILYTKEEMEERQKQIESQSDDQLMKETAAKALPGMVGQAVGG